MQHNSQYFRYFDWAHLHIQFEIPLVELNVNLFNEIADQVHGGGETMASLASMASPTSSTWKALASSITVEWGVCH